MNHIKEYLAIILAFFVMVGLYEACHSKDAVITIVKTDTVYKQKTLTKYKKGSDIPYVIIATDTIQNYIHDTITIIKDYLIAKAYSDTIRQDSNTFVISDTISHNSIQSRKFEALIHEKTILTTITKEQKLRNTLYWGFRGDFSESNGLEVLSTGIMLNVKNKALMGLNLNINKNYNISYSGSVYFKIGKR